MRRDLLVARADEPDATLAERIEKRDVRVTAQAEDHVHADALEIFSQEVRRNARLGRRRGRCCGRGHGAHRCLC